MKLLVFSKPAPSYRPFFNQCSDLVEEVKIVYPTQHPRRKESQFQNFVNSCHQFAPDIIISFYYNRIIQNEILSFANLTVNFHGSLLPNYAGSHALNWQIINGEKVSGVTIHELTKAIDGGRIIAQDSFQIDFEDTARDVLKKGIRCSVDLLSFFVENYKSGMISMHEQTKSGHEFVCRKRTPEDGEITKEMTHLEAYNMIRALVDPWPGAFYYDNGNNKIILNEYLSIEEVKRAL